MGNEEPVGFCLSWQFQSNRPFDEASRPAQEHKIFQTSQDAETARQKLIAQFGDRVGVHCITPVYVTSRTREGRLRKRQLTVGAAWHTQVRPAGRR
jgi:hypothetical protein